MSALLWILLAAGTPAGLQALPRGQVIDDVRCAADATAGVIASSAGYPDSRPRSSLPFVVFGTAGRDDFNYIEMKMLERPLKTPHRIVIFEGGHTLPPDDVAMAAIEWLEVQGMKSGARVKDEALIARLWDVRQPAIAAAGESTTAVHLLQDLVDDFTGLRDTTTARARLAALAKQPDIKRALSRERDDVVAEERLLDEFVALEAQLRDDERRQESLLRLRRLMTDLNAKATSARASPERDRSRRVLRIVTMGAAERIQDEEYLKLIRQFGGRQP